MQTKTYTIEEIEEHKDAAKWNAEPCAPKVGDVVKGKKIVQTKCMSAFWFTENILMKKSKLAPNILAKQHESCATVLYLVVLEG